MVKDKTDKRKCDGCHYFEVSPNGCRETCHAIRIDPTMNILYAERRMNGNKQNCKSFITNYLLIKTNI